MLKKMLLSFIQTLWSIPGKPAVLFLSYAWGLSCYQLPNQAPTLIHNEQEGCAIPAYAIGFDITLSYGYVQVNLISSLLS